MEAIASALCSLLFLISASIQDPQPASALRSLVSVEQEFSKTATDRGTRDAFLAFIADDGVLFRPSAVNGKQWLLAHPSTPGVKRALLAWQPNYASIAQAGDLGFTTGPWEYRTDVSDAKPAAYGTFVTVWKKQIDGSWRFVIDLGISHPQSAGPLKLWRLDETPGKSYQKTDIARELKSLSNCETQLATLAQKESASAYQTYAAPDLRLMRDGSLPFLGKSAALKAVTDSKEQMTFHQDGGNVSSSGDLGYTYGTYESVQANNARGNGNYLHIWRKTGGAWRIVMDVANPVQN
ncbi:MAG: DUF4440 domain-containing protein [Pyrinomonadaceae bacterium]